MEIHLTNRPFNDGFNSGFNWHFGIKDSTREACAHEDAHLWQTDALNNRKVEGIKKIRSACGFGLKEAKDVLECWLENRQFFTKKVYELPSTPGTVRRVTDNLDGTFKVEVITVVECENLGELLNTVGSFNPGPFAR